jgi:hypothetical protein
MKTFKWLKCSFPVSVEELSEKIRMEKYTDENGSGFLITRLRHDSISGKHIQKKVTSISVTNPFGDENEVEFIIYDTTIFTISFNESWVIEIENPGRTIKSFINDLSKIVGFGFYVSEASIDLEKFLKKIDSIYGKNRVSKIEISDINLDNKGLGSLNIKSKQDARSLLKNYITNQKQYKFKSFQTYFLSDDLINGWIEVKSNCTVTIKNIPESYFLPKFRDIILPELTD